MEAATTARQPNACLNGLFCRLAIAPTSICSGRLAVG
jgi:hypothetical protein